MALVLAASLVFGNSMPVFAGGVVAEASSGLIEEVGEETTVVEKGGEDSTAIAAEAPKAAIVDEVSETASATIDSGEAAATAALAEATDGSGATAATASGNAWDRLNASGKQSSLFKGDDGKYYAVKGSKIQVDAGATSSNPKALKISKKGAIKVGKSGTATLTSELYGTVEATVIDPKLKSKKAETQVGGVTELSLENVPEGVPVAWYSCNQDVVQVVSGNCYGVG
ncbi:MAG: hypothetical protein K5989_06850, partial [Lachnospiraceae bacterium]|nr:hypothetical protein [Lachnospiraceae bacterium]